MPKVIAESDVEENFLAILDSLGYKILRGDNEASLPGVDIVRNFIIFEKDKVTIKKLPRIINTGQRIKHLNRL